ncbi:MAG: hypothetical protein HY360_19105 [Verrucomicrobia bacterium]|nr:hypothetical protein [Verrucomicrobiota bacterium]
MHDTLESLHARIWSLFYQPKQGILYTFINPRTRQPVLPTADEVLRCIPNTAGWGTPIEDSCLCAGTYLDAMLLRHAAQPTRENERKAREIFRGLMNLAGCGRRRGFIARGLLPDGKTYYPDTSVDQYTMFLYGLWRYFESPVATSKDRDSIRKIVSNICLQLEEDEFVIQTDAGSVATFSDINAMIYGRVERVLQPFAVGWKICGNLRFAQTYGKLKAEQNGRRLKILKNQGPPPKGKVSLYALLQTQVALRCLCEIESDKKDRVIYESAMNRIGRAAPAWIGQYRNFGKLRLHDDWDLDWRHDWNHRMTDNIWIFGRQLYASGRFDQVKHSSSCVREPCEAVLAMLLAPNSTLHKPARIHFDRMLRTVEFDHTWICDDVNYYEHAFHLLGGMNAPTNWFPSARR